MRLTSRPRLSALAVALGALLPTVSNALIAVQRFCDSTGACILAFGDGRVIPDNSSSDLGSYQNYQSTSALLGVLDSAGSGCGDDGADSDSGDMSGASSDPYVGAADSPDASVPNPFDPWEDPFYSTPFEVRFPSAPAESFDPFDPWTDPSYDDIGFMGGEFKGESGNGFTGSDFMGGYGFDGLGRVNAVTDPRGVSTGYGFDAIGNPVQLSSPDAGMRFGTFDVVGLPVSSMDALGQSTSYSFDAGRRISQLRYADGSGATFAYDQGANGVGRLTQMTDNSGVTSLQYDAQGRVVQRQVKIGTITQTTQSMYDAGGRLTATLYPSGARVDYVYGGDSRVHQINVNGQVAISNIAYDGTGTPTAWMYANGQQVQRAFDSAGRPVQNSLFTQSLDTGNRITSMTPSSLNYYQRGKQYGYDSLDQLIGFGDGRQPITYGYDANGNRTFDQLASSVNTYNTDPGSNRLLSVTTASGGTLGLSYNANGSVTLRGNSGYTYNAAGQLQSMGRAQYVYNALGQRVSKLHMTTDDTVGNPFVNDPHLNASYRYTRLYAYGSGGAMIGEYFGNGERVQETVYFAGQPALVLTGNGGATQVFYVHADHLGTPRQIFDGNRNTVWAWEAATFGSSLPNENLSPTANPAPRFTYNLRMPGQYYDAESGLFYNWHRYYDPQMGRYLQSDPMGLTAGTNTYAYVGGNPISLTDPEGLNPDYWPTPGLTSQEQRATNEQAANIGLVGTAIIFAPAAARVLIPPAIAIAQKNASRLSFDGPSPGLAYGNGRICQVRVDKKPFLRLDYHPYLGTNGQSRLHLNIWSEGIHIPLDPRSLGD